MTANTLRAEHKCSNANLGARPQSVVTRNTRFCFLTIRPAGMTHMSRAASCILGRRLVASMKTSAFRPLSLAQSHGTQPLTGALCSPLRNSSEKMLRITLARLRPRSMPPLFQCFKTKLRAPPTEGDRRLDTNRPGALHCATGAAAGGDGR